MANRSNINFNSIKVRLEHMFPSELLTQILFQFHKGTIRTTCLLSTDKQYGNFNSIKVRLELIISQAIPTS